jgi:hypothetical protein
MRFRHASRLGKALFAIVLGLFGLMAVVAAYYGWWIDAAISVVLALMFVGSAPFVLGHGWKPRPPRSTRRPVVRRRR